MRQKFTSNLCKLIQLRQLPISFIALLPIVAHDPESDLKAMVTRFITRLVNQQKNGIYRISLLYLGDDEDSLVVEQSFVRLLYILGHHPDFTDEIEDLNMFMV